MFVNVERIEFKIVDIIRSPDLTPTGWGTIEKLNS